MDYVKLQFPSLGVGATDVTCGQEGNTSVVYMDGSQTIKVEFHANRYIQASGFMIFVWCSDPGFDSNLLNSQATSKRKRSVEETPCTTVSDAPREIEDPLEILVYGIIHLQKLMRHSILWHDSV